MIRKLGKILFFSFLGLLLLKVLEIPYLNHLNQKILEDRAVFDDYVANLSHLKNIAAVPSPLTLCETKRAWPSWTYRICLEPHLEGGHRLFSSPSCPMPNFGVIYKPPEPRLALLFNETFDQEVLIIRPDKTVCWSRFEG